MIAAGNMQLEPPPPEVEARMSVCAVPAGPPLAAVEMQAERFRPAEPSASGDIVEVPLEVEDVLCLHAALRAVLDFSWFAYRSLRTIPETPGVVEPARADWTALDTAFTIRMGGIRAFGVLARNVPRTERWPTVVRHFEPLLTPGGERWVDAVLGAAGGAQPAWRVPTAVGTYVRGLGALTERFFDLFSATIEPADDARSRAWARALNFAFTLTVGVAIPVRSVYHGYHGTSAIERLEPRVSALCAHLRDLLGGDWVDLLQTISPEAPDRYRRVFGDVLSYRERIGCALMRSAVDGPRRSMFNAADFHTGEALELQSAREGRDVIRVFEADDTLKGRPIDREIHWALPPAWERLARASDLVNEAGFVLVLNAGNNRWGGAHPPHDTHQNGLCFDLDIAVPLVPGDTKSVARGKGYRIIPNLAQLRRVDAPDGAFHDERGRSFNLVPKDKKDRAPTAHTMVDRLALWVALQAMQVAGMSDVLYADFASMEDSLRHLLGRVRAQSVQTIAVKRANLPRRGQPRQLFEPIHHYDHLHVEAPPIEAGQPVLPGAFTGSASWGVLHEQLLKLAAERDQSPAFLDFAFGVVQPRPTLEGQYCAHWEERVAAGRTPLLPVWDRSLCPRVGPDGRCAP